MNGSSFLLLQATRGPILLIVLGLLVLIDYMGIYGFNRTWPVLIILFGVMKFLEQITKTAPPPPPPYDYTTPPGGNAI